MLQRGSILTANTQHPDSEHALEKKKAAHLLGDQTEGQMGELGEMEKRRRRRTEVKTGRREIRKGYEEIEGERS